MRRISEEGCESESFAADSESAVDDVEDSEYLELAPFIARRGPLLLDRSSASRPRGVAASSAAESLLHVRSLVSGSHGSAA